MPEFILKRTESPVAVEFDQLEPFTRGYIEALFFTSECPSVGSEEFETEQHQADMREGCADGTIPGDVGFAELHPTTLESIISDCGAFQREGRGLLRIAYSRPDYSPEQAGRDFWYTRNGHGVGFWDREQLTRNGDELGDALSKVAKRFGDSDAYFEGGSVYVAG